VSARTTALATIVQIAFWPLARLAWWSGLLAGTLVAIAYALAVAVEAAESIHRTIAERQAVETLTRLGLDVLETWSGSDGTRVQLPLSHPGPPRDVVGAIGATLLPWALTLLPRRWFR